MATLTERVSIAALFARSANLERDAARVEPLDGYVVTARALDVVERIARTAASGQAGGAWSLTGPYGSGKSSLALLIDAAFGNEPVTRQIALELIDNTSPTVGKLVREAHRSHGTGKSGFHSALVTADREPLSHTILRALHSAVVRRYGRIPATKTFPAAAVLRGALEDAARDDPRRSGPSPASLIEIARCLAQSAPLLLIVDEFGKNLEAFRDGVGADPYLMQQLAEAGQSSAGLPIFVLTLQHLSFEDYLGGTDVPQRREWAKVQGRFEDVAFVESPAQTRALIRTVFRIEDRQLHKRVERWAQRFDPAMRSLGIADLADVEEIASCYPLHPLAAVVLPELCSRYGQNERTLFSFLAGPDPTSASSFLGSQETDAGESLPSVGLSGVYDFFVSSGIGARQSSRWTEVAVRIRDSHGLTQQEADVAKAIALLNLVSTAGTVRASRQVLQLIDSDLDATLSGLEAAGIVTYRDFADEYRIWQGTDVDIRQLLDSARQQVKRQQLVEILSHIDEPTPMVAARHSAENQILRVFKRRYASGTELVEPPDAHSDYDGELLLVADSASHVPTMTSPKAHLAKPVVVAIPADLAGLDEAAREVAAVNIALKSPDITGDWVARRELGERLAQTRSMLDIALANTFSSDNCRWLLLRGDNGNVGLPGGRGSGPLSSAADHAYWHTPTVRNEMLNRTSLTSQGAKARRILLEAMINHGTHTNLDLDGYGPEVAMYRSFLEHTGLHGVDSRNEARTFRSPTDRSTLRPAWDSLVTELRRAKARRINLTDIYTILLSPPIGMKKAVVPVFVTAALLAYSDEVAIYEHGTFKPLLTPELSERMVRNPGHFDIKHFASTTGARRHVIDELASQLGVGPRFRKHRVPNVLAIVGHLVTQINGLENYTRRTLNLEPPTLATRDVLLTAVEPDNLLFSALPKALGFPSIPTDSNMYPQASAYARAVSCAMDELTGAYELLLDELLKLLIEETAEKSRQAVAGQAAALRDEVLDPKARAFILALANDHLESDRDWIKAIATVVSQKAPAEWRDDDRRRFEHELPQQVAAFRRLIALHAHHRADGGGPFEAFRVTITRPDGQEDVRLVSFDHAERERLDDVLENTMDQLTRLTGSPQRAQQALLALLGERLLPSKRTASEGLTDDGTNRAIQHG
ncbi:MAG: hypothetical protein OXF41_03570 [bacterium]|nr:hypothetical protein [bacterium]